jgi:hypothetical protein
MVNTWNGLMLGLSSTICCLAFILVDVLAPTMPQTLSVDYKHFNNPLAKIMTEYNN